MSIIIATIAVHFNSALYTHFAIEKLLFLLQLIMDAHRLAADLCLLTSFIAPLQNTLCYELSNHSGEYADDFSDVRGRFDALLEAISNITGVPITTEAPPVTDPVDEEEINVHEDESRSPMVSGSHRDTRQANQLPTAAATVVSDGY